MELQSLACCTSLQPSFSIKNRACKTSCCWSKLSQSFRKRENRGPGHFERRIWPVLQFAASPKRRNVVCYLPDSNVEGISDQSVSSNDEVLQQTSIDSRCKINTSLAAGGKAFFSRESFRGKSGVVSFNGLTHELLEERELISSPFKDNTGSLMWILGPVALISSLVLPQFILDNVVYAIVNDPILAETITSFFADVIFYFGVGTFLFITDHVQKPYLEFSSKRWSLITGLRGYLLSAFLTMGLKIVAPLLAVFVVWPVIGLPAFASVAPFLLGCVAQYLIETKLEERGSSCWPLVPILFEVYRLYQLSKAANFIETLLLQMKEMPKSPAFFERSQSLVSLVVVFQFLGLVCLWSLVTFLLRLFPSRPVAERIKCLFLASCYTEALKLKLTGPNACTGSG
ncbi:hypothetical protein H6P81_020984 [Aristolochia fimbriata]|uniref:Uncharacterized protein n=1 Tax=Aristolochia fimbriata TaxID=158543 RepID=A0AAV7DX22_ARIFI|nr:hypothetical protein H6P81_020984 [Aristolochia fimbriata]